MIQVSDDGSLPLEHQVALVVHQLRLRGALEHIPPLLRATWPFPELGRSDAVWLERKRQQENVDWPWFASAIEFLKGEGSPESPFERVKAEVMNKIEKEITECQRINRMPSSLITDERRKLIGGLGGVRSDMNDLPESFWDKTDSGAWREQN
jgi:hypothetical protein